jgi:hypothetical protein
MENHTPLPAPAFNGLFARGKTDNCPSDHAIDLLNVKLSKNQLETRDGIGLDISTDYPCRRAYLYQRFNEVTRLIYLGDGGKFYDSVASTTVPILTVVGATDFSALTLYNRVYISPHDGTRGIENEFLYVYDGSVCRVAAGIPPSPTPITANNSPDDGRVELGIHLFGYVYETTSGYFTRPSGFVKLDAPGSKKVDLKDIPNGPPGTQAKHIVATKVLGTFNGDYENQMYFFVPSGTIPDNVGASITISYYDSELIDTSDYLTDNIPAIPAGVGMTLYNDRLCIWGEYKNPNVIRVSAVQEPEVINEIEGYTEVTPDDGGGTLQTCRVLRGQLYMFKNTRCSVTVDNGSNIAFWGINKIDSDLGSFCHGVAGITNLAESTVYDNIYVGNKQGLWLFNGYFPNVPLTWGIEGYWNRINFAYLHKVQIVLDTTNDLFYITVPLDANNECSHLIVGDYENGMTPEAIKWSIWEFPYNPTTLIINVDTATKRRYLQFGSIDNNFYKQEPGRRNDNGEVIISFYRFCFAPPESYIQVHFTGFRTKAIGSGELDLTLYSIDDSDILTPHHLTLESNCRYPLQRKFNFSANRASVKIGVNAVDEWFLVNSAVIYAKDEFMDRPEVI